MTNKKAQFVNALTISIAVFVLLAGIISIAMEPSIVGFAVKDKVDKKVSDAFNNQDEVDVIVLFKEDSSGVQTKQQNVKQKREEILATLSYDDVKENPSIAASSKKELKLKHTYSTVGGFSGKISKSALNKLKNNPDVKGVYLDEPVSALLTTSVPHINANSVWNISVNGAPIKGGDQSICIVDTGVDYTHSSLGSCTATNVSEHTCKVIAGHDFCADGSACATEDEDPMDVHGHGTHVAGIAAANGSIIGVAPDARIVAIRVLNSTGGGSTSNVLAGVDWCITNSTVFNISIISMSLGGGAYNQSTCPATFDSSFQTAIALNMSIFAASGNGGSDTLIASPACSPYAIAVGNANNADVMSSSSDTNNLVDIIAPGSSITSTALGGGSTTLSGTSMATPHVAGVAALLYQYDRLSNNRPAKQNEVLNAIRNSDVYVTDAGLSFPRVNALRAVRNIFVLNSSSNKVTVHDLTIQFNSVTNLENVSEAFIVTNNFISLNASKYALYNKSSNVTFNNLTFQNAPAVRRDGMVCADCQVLSYSGGVLSFTVPHFSNYTAGSNSQLEIFDQSDVQGGSRSIHTSTQAYFYANYSNISSGVGINPGNCAINFTDLNTVMAFNATSTFYEFNRTFATQGTKQYNVSCSAATFESLNTTDSFFVSPACLDQTPNINITIAAGVSSNCTSETITLINQSIFVFGNLFLNNTVLQLQTDSSNEIILFNSSLIAIGSSIRNVTGQIALTSHNYSIINITSSNISSGISLDFRGNSSTVITNSLIESYSIDVRGNTSAKVRSSSMKFGTLQLREISNTLFENSNVTDDTTITNAAVVKINNSFVGPFSLQGTSSLFVYNSTLNISTLGQLGSRSTINLSLPRSIVINISTLTGQSRIIGYVDLPSNITTIASNANVERYYPVQVNYTNGTPVVNRDVNVTNSTGAVVYSTQTDVTGLAWVNINYTGATNGTRFNVTVNPKEETGILGDTPIIIVLDVPNNLPVVSNVFINSTFGTNFTTENLTAYWTATDADGDNITNITDWRLNGNSIAVFNYPFKNHSSASSTAIDYSTNANDATVTGAVWTANAGQDGTGAYTFTSDTINSPSGSFSSLLGGDDTYSVEAWFNITSLSGFPMLVSNGLSGNDRWFLQFDTDRFYIGSGINIGNDQYLLTMPTNGWVHLVYAKKTSTYGELYVNGVNQTSRIINTGGITTTPSATSELRIGSYQSNSYFPGQISAVRIYNRTLTTEQILLLNASRMDVISSNETTKGETWAVNITPNDGTQDGVTTLSNSVVILNSLPVASNVSINSTFGTNLTTENLTAYWTSTDADGDNITNITDWRINGQSLAVFNVPFEKNGTFNASDYSTFANHASSVNSNPVYNLTGGHDGGGAYDCDSTGDEIQFPDAPQLDGFNNMTISVWVKPRSSQVPNNEILGKHTNAPSGWVIEDSGTGLSYYFTFVIGGSFQATGTATTLTANQWQHFVVLRNGTNVVHYLNGVQSAFGFALAGPITDSTADLYVCDSGVQLSRTFNGMVDDLKIYNRTLSYEQILLLNASQNNIISSQETKAGENWSVAITPNDGSVDGITILSNNLTILNLNVVPNITIIYPNGTNLTQTITEQDNNVSIRLEAGINQTFNITAIDSDASALTFRWFVNQIEIFTGIISEAFNSLFSNLFSSLGIFNITVLVNDSSSNDTFTFFVNSTDTTPPYFNQTITSFTIEAGLAFNSTINATDSFNFSSYVINDTTNFFINDTTGLLRNATGLVLGAYGVNITINDTSNNENSTVFTITVQDTTPPYFNQTPTNFNAVNTTPILLKINGTDSFAFANYSINDTVNFFINQSSGVLTNATGLAIKTYALNVTINDTSNNKNSTVFSITMQIGCTDADGDGFNGTASCGLLDCNDNDANTVPPASNYVANRSLILCGGTYNLPTSFNANVSSINIQCNQTILNGTNTNSGINITASNVTLAGCTLQGYTDGVYVGTGYNNLSFTNLVVRNVTNGINFEATSSNNRFINNTIANTTQYAISIITTGNNVYENNTITSGNAGIFISTGPVLNELIKGNRFTGLSTPIFLSISVNNSRIVSNTFNHSSFGIFTNSPNANNSLLANVFTNVSESMRFSSRGDNTYANNTMYNASTALEIIGIVGVPANRDAILDNIIVGARTYGIRSSAPSADNVLVRGNHITNTTTGISFSSSASNRNISFINNTILNTTSFGIEFGGSGDINVFYQFINNTISCSSGEGLRITGNPARNATIFQNTVSYCSRGLNVQSGGLKRSIIQNNRFVNASSEAIRLTIAATVNNTIINNSFANNAVDILSTLALNNTLIIINDENRLEFHKQLINVTQVSNLFIDDSIVSVNSSSEPQMNQEANVSFTVPSCTYDIFNVSGFFTSTSAADSGATYAENLTGKNCSGTTYNFTVSGFSTYFAKLNATPSSSTGGGGGSSSPYITPPVVQTPPLQEDVLQPVKETPKPTSGIIETPKEEPSKPIVESPTRTGILQLLNQWYGLIGWFVLGLFILFIVAQKIDTFPMSVRRDQAYIQKGDLPRAEHLYDKLINKFSKSKDLERKYVPAVENLAMQLNRAEKQKVVVPQEKIVEIKKELPKQTQPIIQKPMIETLKKQYELPKLQEVIANIPEKTTVVSSYDDLNYRQALESYQSAFSSYLKMKPSERAKMEPELLKLKKALLNKTSSVTNKGVLK